MNISNLSQETLIKLVKLAIESAPTKAAYIILDGIPVVIAPTAQTTTVELSQHDENAIKNRRGSLSRIFHWVNINDRVGVIKQIRAESGCGLKEAVDIMKFAFPKFNYTVDDSYHFSVTEENYWVRALTQFTLNGDVIMD